jgi:hypothetical protein
MLEFALCGIPMVFVWISIVQLAIGMWRYELLQFATKTTGAYIVSHGAGCDINSNTCGIQIKNAAQVMRKAATGIPTSAITMTFTPVDKNHTAKGTSVTCRLDNCLTNTTAWPPAGYRDPGFDTEVSSVFTFRSALWMVAPGAGKVRFGVYNFKGYTHQMMLF